MSDRLAFVLLGPGSPQRAVVADALAASARDLGRTPFRAEPGTGWTLADGRLDVAVPEGCDTLFLESAAWDDPRDFLEAVAAWLPASGIAFARVLTVLPCAYAERHSAHLAGWIDLWLHFTDYLFLVERDDTATKWINALTAKLKAEALPCHVEFWKADSPRNPALVLLPEARRIAKLFDVEPTLPKDIEAVIEEGDEDDEEEVEPPDSWLERLPYGQRARPLPALPRD